MTSELYEMLQYALDELYDAISESGEVTEGMHITLPFSGIVIPLDLDFRLPDINLPSFSLSFPAINLNIEIDLAWLQLLIPGWNVLVLPKIIASKFDFPIPGSQHLYYEDGGSYKKGTEFDPVQQTTMSGVYKDYQLFRIVSAIIYGLYKLGLSGTVARFGLKFSSLFNSIKKQNYDNISSLSTTVGSESLESGSISKLLKVFEQAAKLTEDENIFDEYTEAFEDLESIIGVDPDDPNFDSLKELLNTIRNSIGLRLRL